MTIKLRRPWMLQENDGSRRPAGSRARDEAVPDPAGDGHRPAGAGSELPGQKYCRGRR